MKKFILLLLGSTALANVAFRHSPFWIQVQTIADPSGNADLDQFTFTLREGQKEGRRLPLSKKFTTRADFLKHLPRVPDEAIRDELEFVVEQSKTSKTQVLKYSEGLLCVLENAGSAPCTAEDIKKFLTDPPATEAH